MNADLINKWNTAISPLDIVYYLGDFSLGKNWVREIAPLLNGQKYLICGNHDWCHPAVHKNKEKERLKYEKMYLDAGFLSVDMVKEIEIAGTMINMCHLPYAGSGDHTYQERYTNFRLKDEGKWLLCGHVHEKWKVQNKMINVGVDVWDMKPVSETQILEIISTSV